MHGEITNSATVAVFELARVKYKTTAMTGVQYIKYVQNTVFGNIRQMMLLLIKIIVYKEKYQFTPQTIT